MKVRDFILVTLFLMFHFIAKLLRDLCPVFRCPSRIGQTVEQPNCSYQIEWLTTMASWSQLRAKLRDWAVRPVLACCYSWAALSLIDSKIL